MNNVIKIKTKIFLTGVVKNLKLINPIIVVTVRTNLYIISICTFNTFHFRDINTYIF